MLSPDIIKALETYTANMKNQVTFVVQAGVHPKRNELITFLSDVASVSQYLKVDERQTDTLRGPLSFYLEVEGRHSGISFSGIPSGHEFNSLVLAFLQLSGTPLKLENSIQAMVKNFKETLSFEVFVSLSCHNCPDVVQALNQFAVVNPNIHVEMIDGGLYPDLIEERNIQGVPSVYLNGENFSHGKMNTATLLDKLLAQYPEARTVGAQEGLPTQDVTVIGGGPAGISAAIYAARKGLKVTIIADRIGGQVKDTVGIENLISVPYTTGPELSDAMRTHLSQYKVTLREHLKVSNIKNSQIKTITLSSGEKFKSKTIVVATGANWRELGVPGEKENIGNGVAYCPHCDGPFFKGKDVAVIGGGNSGIEAALDLSGIVKSVTVFEFMPEMKADKVLLDKAKSKPNINFLTNVATKQINAESGKVSSIEYVDRESEQTSQLSLSGVFVQIGLVPNSGFIKDLVSVNRAGEIEIDAKGKTSAEGIFACGDVTTVPFKQIIIGMGEGAKAGLAAYEYVSMNDALLAR